MSFRPFRFLRRHWKRLAAAFALVIVLGIVALFANRHSNRVSGDRELAAICKQLDEREPGWRFDEIQAGIPLLPPAEDGYSIVDRFKAAGGASPPSFYYHEGLATVTESLPLYALIEQSEYLETQASNLQLVQSLSRFKTGRHPVAWTFPVTYIPTVDTIWNIQSLLEIDCRMAAHKGDFRRAFDGVRAIGSLHDTWSRRELFAVVFGRQCGAILWQGQLAMEALALGEAGDMDLERLQHAFLEMSRRYDLPLMIFFERASGLKWMEKLRNHFNGPAYMSLIPCGSYERLGWSERLELDAAWWKYFPHAGGDMAAMLKHCTDALETAKVNAADMHARMTELESNFKRTMDGDGFEKRMMGWHTKPAFAAYAAAQWNASAAAGTTAIGLACERYRLEHGAWPAKLADLKPRYMAEIPVDPFTSRDFHYARLPDGIAIYRVPEGTIDHGGTYWDMRRVLSPLRWSEKEGKDLRGEPKIRLDDAAFVGPPEYLERIEGWARGGKGFRLWNPEIRKKPLNPVMVHERPAEMP